MTSRPVRPLPPRMRMCAGVVVVIAFECIVYEVLKLGNVMDKACLDGGQCDGAETMRRPAWF